MNNEELKKNESPADETMTQTLEEAASQETDSAAGTENAPSDEDTSGEILPDAEVPLQEGITHPLTAEEVSEAAEKINRIIENVDRVILGKHEVISLVVLALLAQGHVLIEDVPGVGKTSLINAIAKSIDCGFKRIQFTPDLMPSDVSGFSVYNQKTGEFEFREGGVMSNLVLADEINRASAKTQSSLLEAMEERQVTVDGKTYKLEEPFMVMATQNPLESFGTYPLPEAQIDRFLIKCSIGYPSISEEARVILMPRDKRELIESVATKEDICELSELAKRVIISDALALYISQVLNATRTSADTVLGSSPRGGISLVTSSRVYALMNGRDYVLPDDIKYLAPFVLSHRLTLTHEAKVAGKSCEKVVEEVLDSVIVPTELQ